MKAKFSYDEAIKKALTMKPILKPACKRIEIAGSLRREKQEVGDIELVAIPKLEIIEKEIRSTGLNKYFAKKRTESYRTRTQINCLEEKIEQLTASGTIKEFIKNGEKFKSFIAFGMQVDLFITTKNQWGVIFMIRTGSKDYSHQFMIELNRGKKYKIQKGHLWALDSQQRPKKIIPTRSEFQLYSIVGLPYKVPKDRVKEVK